MSNYQITFIASNGETKTVEVEARNEFEAIQLAGAFGKVVLSLVNLDL